MRRVRVALSDSHRLFSDGLARLLRDEPTIDVVMATSDIQETIRLARQSRPDVLLLDIALPSCEGIAIARRLRTQMPELKVIMLSPTSDERHFLAAARAGVHGYLLKTADPSALVKSIHSVANGEVAIPRAMTTSLLREFSSLAPSNEEESLTSREREILIHLAHGSGYKQIADRLMISDNTVRAHVRNMIDKLGVGNRARLIAFAAARGFGEFDASSTGGESAPAVAGSRPT
ncbi:MAG: response regulator transcription factor [Chloroflexi bacterium]|nr:response regulator transcription factor [Chloroflexota bacterium]